MTPEALHLALSRSLVSLVASLAAAACGPTSNTDTGQVSSSTTSVSGGSTSGPGSTTGVVDPSTTTGTSNAGPTGDTGVPTSGGDSSFIIQPDGFSCLAGDPDRPFRCSLACDVFKQDCKRGEKCTAFANDGGAWNAMKCVPVTGTGVPGDVCTVQDSGVSGLDDCEKGAMCWDVDKDTNMGICVALCTGTPNAPVCAPDFACAIVNSGVLNLCLPICHPLIQDCPGDEPCLPINDGFVCVSDASGDMGQTNDPCEFANACDKGLVCLATATATSACMQDATGCCQPFCDFTAMEACPNPDQKCVQWFGAMMPIPPGLEDVGVCAIPP